MMSDDDDDVDDMFLESVEVWFGKLTTLKTLRSRPKGLRLSKLLPLLRLSKLLVIFPLRLFSFIDLTLEPLAVLLLALVMMIKRRKTNILASCLSCSQYFLQDQRFIKFYSVGFLLDKTRKNMPLVPLSRLQGELQCGTGGANASFVSTCARSA